MIPLDCAACGVCCISPYCDDRPWVDVKLDDLLRMSRRDRKNVAEVARQHRPRTLKPSVILRALMTKDLDGTGVCSMLEGQLGLDAQCSIYDRRPDVCRQYEVGGAFCRHKRLVHGIDVRKDQP